MEVVFLFVVLTTAFRSSAAVESRIVGGTEAEPHSFPYQVALFRYGNTFHCSGILISKNYVLTAAHCLGNPFDVVKLGVHDINGHNECQVEQEVPNSNFIVHPLFEELYNDIGLIKLVEPVSFNDCIMPIDLPRASDKDNQYVGEIAIASGWGLIQDQPRVFPDVLRYANLTVIDDSECDKYDPGVFGSCHLCTSGIGPKAICSGDSGGPLAIQSANNVKTLIGISSAGYYLCEAEYPSIFVRVTKFLNWIAENSDVEIRP